MHYVLWGSAQLCPLLPARERAPLFQCTMCFGVLLNPMSRGNTHAHVSFQCTMCFGVLLNVVSVDAAGKLRLCFNALCALGFCSTPENFFRRAQRWMFQCTMCFGVLLNRSTFTIACFERPNASSLRKQFNKKIGSANVFLIVFVMLRNKFSNDKLNFLGDLPLPRVFWENNFLAETALFFALTAFVYIR